MQNQLQKAIAIANKTGDRLIVYNMVDSDDPFVLMSLDEYEKLVIKRTNIKDLTEDELLDKINRDIAVWKNEQITSVAEETKQDYTFSPSDKENIYSRPSSLREIMYSAPKIRNFLAEDSEIQDEIKEKNHWVIPETRKEGAEEIIEEDRQYLEDI